MPNINRRQAIQNIAGLCVLPTLPLGKIYEDTQEYCLVWSTATFSGDIKSLNDIVFDMRRNDIHTGTLSQIQSIYKNYLDDFRNCSDRFNALFDKPAFQGKNHRWMFANITTYKGQIRVYLNVPPINLGYITYEDWISACESNLDRLISYVKETDKRICLTQNSYMTF